MLESLADPAQRTWTVVQRCQHLGMARSWWYQKLEDPLFAARARRCYRSLCDEQLAPVLDMLTQSALLPGREGHPDRKLFLELLGEYTPGMAAAQLDVQKPGERMTDDELLAAFEGRMHLLPPGVRRRLGMDPVEQPVKEQAAAA